MNESITFQFILCHGRYVQPLTDESPINHSTFAAHCTPLINPDNVDFLQVRFHKFVLFWKFWSETIVWFPVFITKFYKIILERQHRDFPECSFTEYALCASRWNVSLALFLKISYYDLSIHLSKIQRHPLSWSLGWIDWSNFMVYNTSSGWCKYGG